MERDIGFLKKHFEDIKRCYFPNWDPEGTWKIGFLGDIEGHFDTEWNAVTYCREKTILFNKEIFSKEDHQIRAVVVHEICHAVVPGEERMHGELWRKEMERVAWEAEKKEKDMADIIYYTQRDWCYNEIFLNIKQENEKK